MPLNKMGDFSFNHADQQDDLYKAKTSAEIKQDFDSRGEQLKVKLNDLIDKLQSIVDGDSGADNIKATAIVGLTGTTVQSLLESLKQVTDEQIHNLDNMLLDLDSLLYQTINNLNSTNTNITKVDQDSISRDNSHLNSLKAHKSENIEYSGSLVDQTNVKGALESIIERVNNIVSQSGTSNTEIVDARKPSQGAAYSTLKARLDNFDAGLAENAKEFASPNVLATENLEIIWVGDSTTDKNLSYSIQNSPTVTLHDEFEEKWLKNGRPLYGAISTVFARSGAKSEQFLNGTVTGASFTGINDVITHLNNSSKEHKIVVFSLGHNDPLDGGAWETTTFENQKQLINRILSETKAYVILRMPNGWVSAQNGATKLDASGKSQYLRLLYQKLERHYKNHLEMLDVQNILGWAGGAWTQTVWATGTSYNVGDFVLSSETSLSVYRCTTAGTSGATPPSGTGASISDGTVVWAYEDYLNRYMADWTHPSQLGYKAIANVVGSAILKRIATIKGQETIYANKPFDYNYGKINEIKNNYKDFDLVASGGLVKTNGTTEIVFDADYERMRFEISQGDFVVVGAGSSNLVVSDIDIATNISNGVVDRQITTTYSPGDFAMVNFNGDKWLCVCRQWGTTSADASAGKVYDGIRDTWVADGTVRWQLLKKSETPTKITLSSSNSSLANHTKGTLVQIYRRKSLNTTIKQKQSVSVAINQYIKIADLELRGDWKSGENTFLFTTTMGTTKVNSALVNIAYRTDGSRIPTASIVVNPIKIENKNEIVAANFILVPISVSNTYIKCELYYRNTSGGARYYGVTLLSDVQNLTYHFAGLSQFRTVFSIPALATTVASLPTTAAGTVNAIGSYTNALYLQSPDGQLRAISVDNAGVLSSAVVS
jgi:lysophospholipase L1-like esterase